MNRSIPRAHRFYLQKIGFSVPTAVWERLSPRELAMIQRYGFWLEALESGKLTPFTEAQQRFVMTVRGHRRPQDRFEVAWSKLSSQVAHHS
jgi:uncharacterized protein YifE (UPF0438 family)